MNTKSQSTRNTAFRRAKRAPLASLAIALVAGVGTVLAQPIPGRYIAVLKADTRDTSGTANALAVQHGLQLDYVYTMAIKGFAFAGAAPAARALARRSEVAYVEPDQVYTAFQQTVPTGIRRCDADAVPGLITGGNVTIDADVAIIDTGLDGTHPDLDVQPQGVRFYTTRKTLKTDANWQDDNGHGTHVGGIIGARDNGIGVVGVAPGVRLWAVKVLDSGGNGTASAVIAGIDWVAQHASTFEVANMSLGGSFSQAINDAVKAGTQAGIVFVVAAGNSAWDAVNYSPASEPTALTVSALDDNDGLPGGLGGLTTWGEYDDTLAQFSNYGQIVDVCAPGVEIYSTYPVSMGGYASMSGTSMAAPHVAGAAALYIARHGLVKSAPGVETVGAAVRDSGWQYGHYASFCDLLYYPRVLDTFREPLLNVAALRYWQQPVALAVSTPADSTKISGTVPIQIATGTAVTAVRCYLDGELIGEGTQVSDGWTLRWSTAGVADGPHTLVAVATDGTSQLAGDAVLVGANNTSAMKPSVRITQPYCVPSDANPIPVSGVTNLAVSAVDLGPVARVDFYFGGNSIGSATLTEGDWMLSWDTTLFADGPGELTAIATGADGSQGISAPTPVAVRNYAVHAGAFTVAKSSGGGQWTTTVTYTIHDAAHQPLPGATVRATWTPISGINTPGTVISVSATTDASGQCSFTQTFGKKYYAAYFEITSVELEGHDYDPTLNDVQTRLAINSP
jgi:subtilisin family serine protease